MKVKRFHCGHPYQTDNLKFRGGKIRCKRCVQEQDAKGNAKRDAKSAGFWSPCELAKVW